MRRSIVGVAAIFIFSSNLAAQTADSTGSTSPFFTWRDGLLAAAFVGGTFAMRPVDLQLAQTFRGDRLQSNRFVNRFAWGIEWFGKPLPVIIGVGMYGVGRVGKMKRVAELGLHGTEALVMAGAVTTSIKFVAGRARPSKNPDNPYDYKLFRGFKGPEYLSFPSGHTTGAFAAAAAVTAQANLWWPGSGWYIGPAMFTGASLVGMSRMYHNGHWASDIVAGAGVGTFSGLKVVRYNHRHPNNRLDGWLLNFTVVPGAGTVSFTLVPNLMDRPRRR